ncbi:acyl-CoA dehydrogenase family protein [Streptomyces sp. SCA3-4]|uniref:acyl-CoA dehydrogenase family protein n=1 Tax=Streptomyces sichuanensis TaxID=2871810 RepID=UPI001CE2D320|nr:acyl-CoA dehydrogenase family protein [Streptomyces sichuanensis]MCA6092951.1 acyl-CoA dehydrogenase family protein [Streptomyces sichuanensis]
MRFALDAEQRAFAATLNRMFSAAGTPPAVRAWARGEHGPGLALWERAAQAGVFALAAPEAYGGVGPLPVEVAVAWEESGRHCVPGPLVETVAVTALLVRLAEAGVTAPAREWVPRLCAGRARATLATPAGGPYALDADVADAVFVVTGTGDERAGRGDAPATPTARAGTPAAPAAEAETPTAPTAHADTPATATHAGTTAAPGTSHPARPIAEADAPAVRVAAQVPAERAAEAHPAPAPAAGAGASVTELRLAPGHGPVLGSLDPARRLARPRPGGELLAAGPAVRDAAACAADWAACATAAQALGVGLALLGRTVAYARQREQFGRAIGSFQAVKHRLADTLVALEFARPLVHGAAVALAAGAGTAPAEVAAAKVAACEAAYAAARTALQVHGAIGYTAECDLSLWIGKARALRSAWGGPEECRRTVLRQGADIFHM